MRKRVFGRQLKRNKNERKALFKSLMSSFVLMENIKTTEAKAKSIKGQIEKLVTKAKKKTAVSPSAFYEHLTPVASEKLIASIAPRFKDRPGGYTRLIRLGNRLSDNAQVVLMEWVVSAQKSLEPKTQALPEGKKQSSSKKETQEESKVSKRRGRPAKLAVKKEKK